LKQKTAFCFRSLFLPHVGRVDPRSAGFAVLDLYIACLFVLLDLLGAAIASPIGPVPTGAPKLAPECHGRRCKSATAPLILHVISLCLKNVPAISGART